MDPKALLPVYRRLRPVQRRIGALAQPFVTRAQTRKAAQVIGLWGPEGIEIRNDDEDNNLFDHLIHDGGGRGPTPLERIPEAELLALDASALLLREAMAQARINIFRLEERIPGVGWWERDLFRGTERLVVDEALSGMRGAKGALIVQRLIPRGDWWFSTGLQGTTLAQGNLETLGIMMRCSELGALPPEFIEPEVFAPRRNILWSRGVLRAWMRPGSLRLVEVEVPAGAPLKPAAKRRRT